MTPDTLPLAARLRSPSMTDTPATWIDRMRMAADEIERLTAERDALWDALLALLEDEDYPEAERKARAALARSKT